MAFNGISEAYMTAKADENTRALIRQLMVFNSCLYLTLAYVLQFFIGIQSLIVANCCNMAFRTITYVYLAQKQNAMKLVDTGVLTYELGIFHLIILTINFIVSVFLSKIFLGLFTLSIVGTFGLKHVALPYIFQTYGL